MFAEKMSHATAMMISYKGTFLNKNSAKMYHYGNFHLSVYVFVKIPLSIVSVIENPCSNTNGHITVNESPILWINNCDSFSAHVTRVRCKSYLKRHLRIEIYLIFNKSFV